jgi:transcriptional regulator NrdR family protein
MTCPDCKAQLIILDSRINNRANHVRRRRGCPRCDYRVTTYEHQFAAKFTASSMRTELRAMRTVLGEALANLEKMEAALSSDEPYFSSSQVEAMQRGALEMGRRSA